MPKKVANSAANTKDNPNCVGDNLSPEFSWSNVPEGTKRLCYAYDRSRRTRQRWCCPLVAYGIPSSVTGFAEGEVSKLSDRYVGGKSTQGVGFYSGPSTPPNTMPHHYTFVLIASLIGHSGSSAFRPTTTTAVSMSLTGSCFSSESAPGPSIMGVEDEAEQSTELPCCNERQVQAIGRTHLIHRPARDIIPPQGGARVSSYRM
jgi:phosphatidylethanolamine-binding protein (PEBP) family uncharacterized protein